MTNSKYSNEALDKLFDDFEKSGPPWNAVQYKWQYEGIRDYFKPLLEDLLEQTRTNTIKAALEALPERPHRPAHNEAHMRLDCAACMLKKAETNLKALIGGDDV